MIHRIVLGVAFTLLLYTLSAQQQFALVDYMLANTGDTLIYEVSAGTTLYTDTLIYTNINFRNQSLTKRAVALKGNRYEKWEDAGIAIYQINVATERAFVLDKPLLWLPASFSLRHNYRDSTQYKELKNNALQSSGILILETNLEGFMSAQTPLRNFVDCLSVTTKMTRQNAAGKREITEWKELYAKHIGLVQSIVRIHQIEPNGKASPLQVTMLQLKKATLGGKLLEGRVRN